MSTSCSIVIPTLNEAKYIRPLLESIKVQTVAPAEVVIVDDGDDETPAIAAEFGARVVRGTASGVSAARKVGFEQASGDIIISTDADSVLPANYVATVQQQFAADPAAAAIFGPVHLYDGPLVMRGLSHVAFTPFLMASQWVGRPNVNGMNFACRRAAYRQVGGFDPKAITAEDVELAQRLKQVGRVRFVLGLGVRTSGRHVAGMGMGGFLRHHIRNYFRILRGKRGLHNFKPYR